MSLEQLDPAPEQDVTLRRKFRRPEDRIAAGKARIEEPYGADLLLSALVASLWKFDPRVQVRNPVMFVVWLGALVTAALTIDPGLFGPSGASAAYNGVVTVILLLTVWFANFAEALAEGRGKAKAASLRRTKTELMARRVLTSGEIEQVPATGPAQGRCRPREQGRGHPDRRRGDRRCGLCGRVGDHRRVRARDEGAGHGHVLLGDRGHSADFRFSARPRHRQSRRKLPRSHDPSRGRRQTAENSERDGADRSARHIDADLRHRGGRHGTRCGLFAGANQHRRSDRAPGRAHSDHHRRAPVRHRHRRHRSHVPVQCPRHVRQGRGGRRRRAHPAARQDRHHHRSATARRPSSFRLRESSAGRARAGRLPCLRFRHDAGRTLRRLPSPKSSVPSANPCSMAAGASTSRRRRA